MRSLTRREVLGCGAAICSLTTVTLGLATEPAWADDGITVLKSGRIRIDLRRVTPLRRVGQGVSIGSVRGRPVGVVQESAGRWVAVDLTCPHQGTTSIWHDGRWVCYSHWSQFEDDGTYVMGPAGTSLSPIPVQHSGRYLRVG